METQKPNRAPAAPPPRTAGLPRRQSVVAFGIGLCVTATLFGWMVVSGTASLRREVDERGRALATAVHQQLERRAVVAESLASYLAVTRGSDRTALRSYVGELSRACDGTVALDWAPRVPAADVRAHEEQQWLQGMPDYRVHRGSAPLPTTGEVFPLHFGIGGGARLDGLDFAPAADVSAMPRLVPTLESALASRRPASAGTLRVHWPEATRFAVVLASPVFAARGGADLSSEFLGYGVAVFEVEPVVRAAIDGSDASAMTVELHDAGPDGPADPLFLSRAARSEDFGLVKTLWAVVPGGEPRVDSAFEFAGRRFVLTATAGEDLAASHRTWVPWLLLGIGLVGSGVAASSAAGAAKQGATLSRLRRRLESERRGYMERLGRVNEDLEREKLDRRRTEESLFREKQQFRLMFNAVPAMIWYKDTKNRFLLVNEAAAAAMGRSVSDMEGRPCAEVVPERAYELYRDDLDIIQSGRPRLGVVEQMPLPDGRVIWTRTDKLPEHDAMGRVVGILVFSQDITEQRQAEAEVRRLNEELEGRVGARTAELQAANQELESFAYSVSHDLRTPLRTIDGFSKLLQEEFGPDLPPLAHDYLARLRGGAQRMGHLIDDLLRLTRVSRAEMRRVDVDLSAVARQAVDDLRRADPGRRIDVVVEATPFAKGDPALLAAVVQNLVENAWKFTARQEAARIEFGSRTVDRDGERTAFYVRDNGVGFDMVYADKLFRAFQRLHTPEEFEGSGIGLATVQRIIRRHGGQVWAESEPGLGATFYFTLGA